MWRIVQHDEADDFIMATGETHSVKEFAERSFQVIGIQLEWSGRGPEEIGRIASIDNDIFATQVGSLATVPRVGDVVVEVDPGYFRPTEVDILIGDSSKAEKLLGWKAKTTFDELVRIMVEADIKYVKHPELDY
jgi:GDPmannose 4,6-dehydratase